MKVSSVPQNNNGLPSRTTLRAHAFAFLLNDIASTAKEGANLRIANGKEKPTVHRAPKKGLSSNISNSSSSDSLNGRRRRRRKQEKQSKVDTIVSDIGPTITTSSSSAKNQTPIIFVDSLPLLKRRKPGPGNPCHLYI